MRTTGTRLLSSAMSLRSSRRRPFAVFAACSLGGVAVAAATMPALIAGPSATAAPDPCAASEVAKTVGSVATSMGAYLDAHPQTNQALTTISQQQGGPQSLVAVKSYFDANPQVAKDMQQLQQPLASLSGRCKLPLTLPQLMGVIQAAQQSGAGLPAGLPAGPGNAQTAGRPGAATPAQPPAASSVSQGGGALPSTAIAGLP
jgi:heme-binding protein